MKICFPLLLLLATHLGAQSKYAVSDIPPELRLHANGVIRDYSVHFDVLNKGEAIETEHKAVTLLNETGAALFGEVAFGYSIFLKIEDIEAAVYDAKGLLVRQLKKKDIEDIKPPQYAVDDSRYKILRLPARAFPYTVEYTVVRHHMGLMFYPSFFPQESPSFAVEAARFSITMPPGEEVRIKTTNLPEGAQKGMFLWEFNNIPPRKNEPYAPIGYQSAPRILSAPTSFRFGGFDGNMTTWQSYGAFMQQLNKTQQGLPPETTQKLQNMVADCPDQACKIRKIYDYLQSNTRYFFVGLGIGGWQPSLASEVDHNKYGDCKGLSNYMVSMLNAVGITAYYAIIRAGDTEQQAQYPDFPNAWFNHIIVCVPNGKDTTWLECTSQTESCGFLSDFTDNRPALLITPSGGQLVQTPQYNETVNTTHRQTNIAIAPDGSASLQSTDLYTGISQITPAALEDFHDETRKEYLYKILKINDFEIIDLQISRKKEKIPSATIQLSLTLPKLASVSGKRIFIPVSLLSTKPGWPTMPDSLRHQPIQADSRGSTEDDQVVFTLPEGYQLESAFAPINITSAFGHFKMSVVQDQEKIRLHRQLILNSNIQPKEKFDDFILFLKTIAKADKMKLVAVKKG
jgi:hypothetical protein